MDDIVLMHLSRGLTFDPRRSAEVMDSALGGLDEKTGYVSQMQACVRGGDLHNGECPTLPTGRIVADVTESVNAKREISDAVAIPSDAPPMAALRETRHSLS